MKDTMKNNHLKMNVKDNYHAKMNMRVTVNNHSDINIKGMKG